jgi:serine/threonine protein kinase
VIHVEAKNEVRKRIVRELRIMHDCNSEYIVDFYGAFQNESGDVIMCMEYMDVGYTFPTPPSHEISADTNPDPWTGFHESLVPFAWTSSERSPKLCSVDSPTYTARIASCIEI